MRKNKVGAIAIKSFALLVVLGTAYQAMAQDATTPYPNMAPIDQYLMTDQGAEIALARSAAPESISRDAEVLVLGRHGFETAVKSKARMAGCAWWNADGGLFSIGPNFGTRKFEPRIASIHRPRAPCCRLLINGRNCCWPAIPRSRSSPQSRRHSRRKNCQLSSREPCPT